MANNCYYTLAYCADLAPGYTAAQREVRPMRHMKPTHLGGRPGYVVRFRHPLKDNSVRTVGLGTRDEAEANQLAHDLEQLCSDPTLLNARTGDPRLTAYDRRVLAAVFGRHHWSVKQASTAPAFTAEDQRDLLDWIRSTLVQVMDRVLRATGTDPLVYRGQVNDALKELERRVGEWAPRNYRVLKEEVKRFREETRFLRPQLEAANRRVDELEAELGRNKKTPLAEAFGRWKAFYASGRSARTWTEGCTVVGGFVSHVGEDTPVGDVRVKDLMMWMDTLKGKKGRDLHVLTRLKRRNYVTNFCNWMYRFYDLRENPAAKLLPVAGASKAPEHIVAIRRYDELMKLINDTPEGYWRTWVAVACLAGPRWREQCYIKTSDVYLSEGYIRITSRTSGRTVAGTKTGRERNVPIERRVLMPLLREWVKHQSGAGETILFPDTSGEGATARTKTDEGVWSDNGVWWDHWRKVCPTWHEMGPAEWRHTAGTAMGHAGMSSLEISRALGNSEDVARRHYIAELSAGKRWPLSWR